VCSTLLGWGAVLFSLTFFSRQLELDARLGPDACSIAPLRNAALLLGQIIVLLLLCVIAVPLHVYPRLHDFCGYSLFYTGAGFLICNCVLDGLCKDKATILVRTVRIGLVASGTVLMCGYWAAFGAMGSGGDSSAPTNRRLFAEALLEILSFALLLLFVSTFAISQFHMRLVLRGERPVKGDVQPPPGPGFAVSWSLFAPAASALVCLSFVVAYPIAASSDEPSGERLQYPYLFLSNAVDYPPASCFGTVIMGAGCVLFAYAFTVRHLEVHARLPPADGPALAVSCLPWLELPVRHLPALNSAATCVGLLAMVALPYAVMAVPIHDAPVVHWTMAAVGFYGSASYAALQLLLDRACGAAAGWPPSRHTLAFRTHIFVFGVGLIAVFSILFGPLGMGGLFGKRTWGVAGDAFCEVVFLSTVLMFISTFYYSASELRFCVTVAIDVDGRQASDGPTTPLLGRHTVGAVATHGTFGDGCATGFN